MLDNHNILLGGVRDLPPMFAPPVMLVRQAGGQGRQASQIAKALLLHSEGLGDVLNALVSKRSCKTHSAILPTRFRNTKRGLVTLKERLVLSAAIVVGVLGFSRGLVLYQVAVVLQGTFVAVLIPMCAPLCLYLGIATWKRMGGFWGCVTLLATSGVAGAALGLSLMFWVLD